MKRSLVLAPVVALLFIATSVAHAQSRRIVVQRFGGPNGASVRAQLVANLMEQPGIEIVSDEEVAAARAQLGLDTRVRGEQYVALARALRVSAFIDGVVTRRRRHWAATIRVRNGATGEELGNASWGGRTAAALSGVRRSYSRIQPYIEASSVPTGAPTARARATPAEETERPWYSQEEEPPDEETPGETEGPAEPAAPSERYDALRVAFEVGTLFRWMHTIATVYAVQRGMSPIDPASELIDEDRRYQSGGIGHFEPGIMLEVYPGAFTDPQVFPYLGLLFSFTHSAFVQTNGREPGTGDDVSVPTDQLDLYVGLRGRYRFGAERRQPEVFLDFGYGLFEFLLGTDGLQRIERNTIIAPFSFSYVQIAGGARYGIVPQYLTVGIDFGYRIGVGIGADTRNVWGVETGPPGGFVFGIEARTELPAITEDIRGFFLALRLSYFQFTTTYRGQVGCAEPGGCGGTINPWEDTRLWEIWPVNPATPTQLSNVVGGIRDGVNDNYFRLQLQLGWQFY